MTTQSQREARARYNEAGSVHRSAARDIAVALEMEASADALHLTLRSPETREDLTLYGAPAVRYVAPSGTPAGWGAQLPDQTPLARYEARVTRSRKGRSSFVVTQRERHIRITGSAGVDPVTRRPIIPTRVDETALIAWADRILADPGTGKVPREYRLTERPDLSGQAAQTMAQRIGGRDYRGARGWITLVPDEERADHWCDTHDYGAEHCGCTIRLHANIGTVDNGGAADGTEERLPWIARTSIDARATKCPACNIARRFHGHTYEPTEVERVSKRTGATRTVTVCGHINGRTGKACGGSERSHGTECDGTVRTVRDGVEVVEVVAYDGSGSGWVGHRRVSHAQTGRNRPQTTRAARQAVRVAAQAAAERRSELTATVLPMVAAMAVGTATTVGTAIVTRVPRRWVVETPDGVTTRHATPAAVVGKLAQLAQ